jgi:hypothetical protein
MGFCARCLNKRSEKGRRKFIKHLQINKSVFLPATACPRKKKKESEIMRVWRELKISIARAPYDFLKWWQILSNSFSRTPETK